MMQLGFDSIEIEIMMDYEIMEVVKLEDLYPQWWIEWKSIWGVTLLRVVDNILAEW